MEIIREIRYSAGEGKTQYDDKDNDMVRVFVDMKKSELRKFKRWMKADGTKPQLDDVLESWRKDNGIHGHAPAYKDLCKRLREYFA